MDKDIRLPPYFGGKARPQLYKWIISLLPKEYEMYIEPFAGMLGILVHRNESNLEVVNDLNNRLVNWWLQVRDNCEELQELLYNTPYSEELLGRYFDTIDEGSDLERAMKYHIVICQTRMHSDRRERRPSIGFSVGKPSHRRLIKSYYDLVKQINKIRDRVRNVVIYNRKAQYILEKYRDCPEAVVYCDPPYYSARTQKRDKTGYYAFDVGGLTELFQAQKGKVAISGYNDEWDELGWDRHELKIKYTPGLIDRKPTDKTEVLWTNYKVDGKQEALL